MYNTDPFPILPQRLEELREVIENAGDDVLRNHLMLSGNVVQFVHHAQETLHEREADTHN